MPASPPGWPTPEARGLLTAGVARGYTVLCLGDVLPLLGMIVERVGSTGLLVIADDQRPAVGADWHALRCSPDALPLRSHVVDAAIVVERSVTDALTAEVRRALVPGGDARFLLVQPAPDALFTDAGLSIRERVALPDGEVVAVRGP